MAISETPVEATSTAKISKSPLIKDEYEGSAAYRRMLAAKAVRVTAGSEPHTFATLNIAGDWKHPFRAVGIGIYCRGNPSHGHG